MGSQGFDIKQNIWYQYNKSEINMEKDVKKWFTGNSRHTYILYFFAKDMGESNKISIKYCITEHMLVDFFNKLSTRSPVRKHL